MGPGLLSTPAYGVWLVLNTQRGDGVAVGGRIVLALVSRLGNLRSEQPTKHWQRAAHVHGMPSIPIGSLHGTVALPRSRRIGTQGLGTPRRAISRQVAGFFATLSILSSQNSPGFRTIFMRKVAGPNIRRQATRTDKGASQKTRLMRLEAVASRRPRLKAVGSHRLQLIAVAVGSRRLQLTAVVATSLVASPACSTTSSHTRPVRR